jgi:DNA-binding NtrC family response regulator
MLQIGRLTAPFGGVLSFLVAELQYKPSCAAQESLYDVLMSKLALVAWIGNTDLRASRGELSGALGPIGQAVKVRAYDEVHLLSDHDKAKSRDYASWLRRETGAAPLLHFAALTGPTRFAEIYEAAVALLNELKSDGGTDRRFVFHLSPGTPAMAAVWILLAKTSYPGELIESSPEEGVRTVSFPFEIAAEYLPGVISPKDDEIVRLTQGLPPEVPEFGVIIHRCPEMKRVIAQARRVAAHDVSVLIQGESGTGKELFARAIHASSARSGGPFVEVNCGAIPSELVESEFFGHTKGAFTGALEAKAGFLEAAEGGTLFLDEIGELPLPAQVKMLRALQEGIVQRVGSAKPQKIDFRVIAATNRNLLEEVAAQRFREDLFHRLAVGVLQLPPLRERAGDLGPLIDYLLDRINRDCAKQAGWVHKNLSAGAKNLLAQHPWPGNIRELSNTLSRAAIWTAGDTIRTEDIRQALFPVKKDVSVADSILNRSLGNDLNLPELIAEVARHYLIRAYDEAAGNKSAACKLVGLPNYQTFTNWMKKFGVKS